MAVPGNPIASDECARSTNVINILEVGLFHRDIPLPFPTDNGQQDVYGKWLFFLSFIIGFYCFNIGLRKVFFVIFIWHKCHKVNKKFRIRFLFD